MLPAGIGFLDGDFGVMAQRACRQWSRDPRLASRLSAVRYALRCRLADELLLHLWSEDMAHVLGELEWCLENAQRGRGQMLLLPG